MRNLKVVFVLLTALVSLAVARTSFAADETTVAREHAQKGKAFMDLGKYTEAASEYEAAYAAKQDPALLLNLAQAYRLAGNPDKALFFYRKYLQHVPKSPYRADIEEKIAALEKQSKSGETSAGTTGATPGGTAPGMEAPPYQGAPPPANPGYAPPPASPLPGPTAPGSLGLNPELAPGGMQPPGGPGPELPPAPPPAADHGQKLKLAGLVTGGAGVLSFVVAAIYGAQAKDAAKKIEDAAAIGGTYQGLQSEDSRGRSAQGKETAFIIVGVAALAGGGILYYLGMRHAAADGEHPPGAVAILPAASFNEVGAAVRVRF